MFGAYEIAQSQYYQSESSASRAQRLPCYLSPVYDSGQQKEAKFSCDFLFVGEFSELEGPKPLIVIPKDGQGSFDLNHFVVDVMAVDYQTSGNHKFGLVDDTQVVFTDKRQDTYAYVHHFTLYDVNARGYVRPFCMAFVTSDRHKLMSVFDSLLLEFTRVSEYFKQVNVSFFMREVMNYLSDLQFTKEHILAKEKKQAETTEDDVMSIKKKENISLEALDVMLKEMQDIADILEPYQNIGIVKDDVFLSNTDDVIAQEVSSLNDLDLTNDTLQPLRKRSGTFSELSRVISNVEEGVSKNYEPKLLKTLNLRQFELALRTLHELCQWGARGGLLHLHTIQQYYKRDLALLSIDKEDLALKGSLFTQSSLLTIGNCIQVNFSGGLNISQDTGGTEKNINFKHGTLHKWTSDDTLDSYRSTESHWSVPSGESPNTSTLSSLEPTIVLPPADSTIVGSFENISVSENFTETNLDEYHIIDVDPSKADNVLVEESRRQKRITVADNVFMITPSSTGYNMGVFLCQHDFSPHIIFSLLIGRPVILLGSSHIEHVVKEMVTTLSLFVPGHSCPSQSVIPWSNRPIRLPDLARVKLVGLCKPDKRSVNYILPHSVRGYISVFHINHKTLVAAKYAGGIITNIHKRAKVLKRDEVLLPYIHSELLQISNKAEAYYHTFCMKDPHLKRTDLNVFQMCNIYKAESLSLLKSLGIAEGDFPIIQYLIEVIKSQQMKYIYSNNKASLPMPVRLDFTQCQVFTTK